VIDDFNPDDEGGNSLYEDHINPYLKELFKDLIQRCYDQKAIDARSMDLMTFIEYCQLPVIIGERLFIIHDEGEESRTNLLSEA
jgi:hypothetical protein